VQSKTRSPSALRSFSLVLQVIRNKHLKRQLLALSLLSPFLYLKTVASVLATLYNSAQRTVF
jgi:hypothetical protein